VCIASKFQESISAGKFNSTIREKLELLNKG
jgi:hypothetical protein